MFGHFWDLTIHSLVFLTEPTFHNKVWIWFQVLESSNLLASHQTTFVLFLVHNLLSQVIQRSFSGSSHDTDQSGWAEVIFVWLLSWFSSFLSLFPCLSHTLIFFEIENDIFFTIGCGFRHFFPRLGLSLSWNHFCTRQRARWARLGFCVVEVFSRQLLRQKLIIPGQHFRNKLFPFRKTKSTTVATIKCRAAHFFCTVFVSFLEIHLDRLSNLGVCVGAEEHTKKECQWLSDYILDTTLPYSKF